MHGDSATKKKASLCDVSVTLKQSWRNKLSYICVGDFGTELV